MRALCPECGLHHEVVRVLDEGGGEASRDVYQVAALAECKRTWLSDRDVLEARARFGEDAIIEEDELDV
jgi:hypothetical protein